MLYLQLLSSAPLSACISGNLMAVKLLCAKSSVELEPRVSLFKQY